MESGSLIIEQAGYVHIDGDFTISNNNNTKANQTIVEVVNDGYLEVFNGKFEMRAKYEICDDCDARKCSAYFTNNGVFSLKDSEFIIGKKDNNRGLVFFYNQPNAITYIDNKISGKGVWLGGKDGSGNPHLQQGIALSPDGVPQTADAQKTGTFHTVSHTYPVVHLATGSFFNVEGADVNLQFAQGTPPMHLYGELYVRDANCEVKYENNAGGQTINIDGGLYVLATDPFAEDFKENPKGMIILHSGGGDLDFKVNGNMWATGLEMPNGLNSGSNDVIIENGATVFIGNVGASMPSENYKVQVKNGGTLYYCGNYSGGGDMVGWVENGGNLFYAQNYYDFDYHNTDESNPNKFAVLYNGPLMNEWRLNPAKTQLTNTKTGAIYNLYNSDTEEYFVINRSTAHQSEVSIFTILVTEVCLECRWKIENGKLKNSVTGKEYGLYVNNQTSYYYIDDDGNVKLVEIIKEKAPETFSRLKSSLTPQTYGPAPYSNLYDLGSGDVFFDCACPGTGSFGGCHNVATQCYTYDGDNIIFTRKNKLVDVYTPQKPVSIPLAGGWELVDGQLVNTTNSAAYGLRSAVGATEDYYELTTGSDGAQMAKIYEKSKIPLNKEDVIVVTSGWYLDGTILKNYTKQNIPYFSHTIGVNGPGAGAGSYEGKGIWARIRDYNGGSGQTEKVVVWYEINPDGTIKILSDIDDFYAQPNAVINTMAGVETNQQCTEKFLTPPQNKIPPNYGDIILPITLVQFKATATPAGGARIEWITQTETNNEYFTLYRSYNGIVFESIATIAGAGTTTVPQFYKYDDKNFIANIAYYRLGQTDYNGKETMSNIVAVRNMNLSTFEIEKLQNNGGDYAITFLFPDSENENRITIYNILSEKKAQYSFAAGTIVAEINARLYPSGTYIVEHTNGVRKTVKKIVIK